MKNYLTVIGVEGSDGRSLRGSVFPCCYGHSILNIYGKTVKKKRTNFEFHVNKIILFIKGIYNSHN